MNERATSTSEVMATERQPSTRLETRSARIPTAAAPTMLISVEMELERLYCERVRPRSLTIYAWKSAIQLMNVV